MGNPLKFNLLLLIFPVAALAGEQTVDHKEVAGASFPYVEAGEGEPVLFVPGAWSDHRLWEPFHEAVAEEHRFITYTQRGFGTEEWPEEPPLSRDVHDADLIALLESWGEPMHLVGWSYSGPMCFGPHWNGRTWSEAS
jgi:pimeloyl-ACP methyl ester carboxylesterase